MTNRLPPTRLGLALGALLLAMAVGACSESPTSPTPSTPTAPTLAMIQTQIFDPGCAGCHTDVGRTPAGGLNLRTGTAFASLVNVASSAQAGAIRVVPSNVNNSYLVRKLEAGATITGLRMPRNGPPFLSDPQVQMIRDWIAAGALNN